MVVAYVEKAVAFQSVGLVNLKNEIDSFHNSVGLCVGDWFFIIG
jgi:hypothetical protein